MHSDKKEEYTEGKPEAFPFHHNHFPDNHLDRDEIDAGESDDTENDFTQRNTGKSDAAESYYIEGRELELLLAGVKMKAWYGLSLRPDGGEDSVTREDIHRILAGLYQKGYVSWDDEVIRMQEPVSDLVRILKEADSCMRIEWNREEEPLLMIYRAGDRFALLEESRINPMSYRFRIWDRETLSRFLRDQAGHIANKKKYNLNTCKRGEE